MDTNFNITMDPHAAIVEPLYQRHIAALRMVSGNGVWIDEGAARLSLWLALTELAGSRSMVVDQPRDGLTNDRIDQLRDWLVMWAPDEIVVDRHIVASIIVVLDRYRDQVARLTSWLLGHEPGTMESAPDDDVVNIATSLLERRQERVIALAQARKQQHIENEHLAARVTELEAALIAELEAKCLTNPSRSTPTIAATAPCAPAAAATSSAAASTPPPPAGRSSIDDPAPATTASTATSTTPAAERLAATSPKLMATPHKGGKRYPMTDEQMRAAVVDCIRQHTIGGIAPSSTWIIANTDAPLQALLKRTNCKYSDLVAETGSMPAPQGRRKSVTPVEPFRTS